MCLQQFTIRHFDDFFLDVIIDICRGGSFLEVMLRQHLVKLARLVQEVILRLINSALPRSIDGHPRVTAPETNTGLPAYRLGGEMF